MSNESVDLETRSVGLQSRVIFQLILTKNTNLVKNISPGFWFTYNYDTSSPIIIAYYPSLLADTAGSREPPNAVEDSGEVRWVRMSHPFWDTYLAHQLTNFVLASNTLSMQTQVKVTSHVHLQLRIQSLNLVDKKKSWSIGQNCSGGSRKQKGEVETLCAKHVE